MTAAPMTAARAAAAPHAVALIRLAVGGATMKRSLSLLVLLAIAACSRPPAESAAAAPAAPSDAVATEGNAWLLGGSTDERFARVAKHLRGFDVAMVERGYRYNELYWAGQDRNWDYAKYQVEKIRTAVSNGVERRPKRAASAQVLESALPEVEKAIAAQDSALFAQSFDLLTATCNACHRTELVPFVHVGPPAVRTSPARPIPAE